MSKGYVEILNVRRLYVDTRWAMRNEYGKTTGTMNTIEYPKIVGYANRTHTMNR